MKINFRKLVRNDPHAGPDELFDEYMRRNGYDNRWDDAGEPIIKAWIAGYDNAHDFSPHSRHCTNCCAHVTTADGPCVADTAEP